jgi:hypothetical protein
LIESPSDCRESRGTKTLSRHSEPFPCPKSVSICENDNYSSVSPAIIKSQSKTNVLSLPTIIESNESITHTDVLPVENSEPTIIIASETSADMNRKSISEFSSSENTKVVDENKIERKSTLSIPLPNLSKSSIPAIHVKEMPVMVCKKAKKGCRKSSSLLTDTFL